MKKSWGCKVCGNGYDASGFYGQVWQYVCGAGLERKIAISQRNRRDIVMHSSGRQAAEAFREDMKAITQIR